MVGGLRDVITCAEFQIEIFMGYDFTGGRIFDFPIDFSMGFTTVQRYCAACDKLSLITSLIAVNHNTYCFKLHCCITKDGFFYITTIISYHNASISCTSSRATNVDLIIR